MSHKIEEIDIGMLSGNYTWHGLPQYILVGNRAVTIEEAKTTADFGVKKVPTYIQTVSEIGEVDYSPSGSFSIIREDTNGVLAPAVGERFHAEPHKNLLNSMVEILMAEYPDLSIAGCGTLSGGASWWIQLVAKQYFVRGDESPNEVRLNFNHTYGLTSYQMFPCVTRIVCDNTKRMAEGEELAKKFMTKHKHTAGAVAKINADMSLIAEVNLHLEKEVEQMEYLANKQIGVELINAFMEEFIPSPLPDASTKAQNKFRNARSDVQRIFASGQHLTGATQTSRYAILQAFTDHIDHGSYTRDETDRWVDALNGTRARQKEMATAWLLAK